MSGVNESSRLLFTEEYLAGTGSKGSSRAGSPAGSDDTAAIDKRINGESPMTDDKNLSVNDFIDLTYFKRYGFILSHDFDESSLSLIG